MDYRGARLRIILVGLFVLALFSVPVYAQDGGDEQPVTVIDAVGNEVTITDTSRIITIGGAVTETVYALGLGDRIVAVDESSIYPAQALDLPMVGYLRFLSAEPVLSVNPTLIIATEDAGPAETVQQLEAAGVTFLLVPAEDTVTGAIEKIRAIAVALSRVDEGEALVADLEADVALAQELLSTVETRPRVMFFFLRGRAVLAVSGEETGADEMIRLAGGENVVSGYTGYQPITAEAVIAAAPDVIMTTSNGVESIGGVEEVSTLPGVAQTPAGASGRIIASMDDLRMLGFTARLGDSLLELTYRIHEEIPRPVPVVTRLDGRFNLLAEALATTDIDRAIREGGAYTLFAPTDEVLAGVDLYSVEDLSAILRHHVVDGEFTAEMLAGMNGETLTTLNGDALTVTVVDSGVMIDGVRVSVADLSASNGVVHGIDGVLMP
ncbi:MAG: ABC transporter substrate-binding protein [Aggregatilineales bacterium]